MTSKNHDLTNFFPDPFEIIYERIKQATNIKTQVQLADILDIRQSSISDAKRRGSIPPDWILKLMENHSINPNWIKYGKEPMLLAEGTFVGASKELDYSVVSLDALVTALVLKLTPAELQDDVSRTLCFKYLTLKPSDTLNDVINRILPGNIAALLSEHIFQDVFPECGMEEKQEFRPKD